ncbi:MAG TPA: cold shock domain-containing protein [bacterium]|nr:cold shock domain-containing protein [bacterium]
MGTGEPWQAAAGEERAVVRIVARGLTGRVKLYNALRGYGFVVSPDAPGDVFFHRSDCRIDPSTLEPGAEVAFDLVEMANGQVKAVRVGAPQGRRAQGEPAAPGDDAGPGGSRPAFRQRVKETAAPLASQQPPL